MPLVFPELLVLLGWPPDLPETQQYEKHFQDCCETVVIKQIDGVFEQPIVFQDLCMGCWDCIEACPLNAVQMNHVT